jgi:DNA-binding MarR family transcriptional regulator
VGDVSAEDAGSWTFLTNHAHVLLAIARNPDSTTREVAELVGITERAVQRIVTELEADGFCSHERRGRRNHYRVHPTRRLRHPMDRDHRVGELLDLLGG